MNRPQPFYWLDQRGNLNCRHGILLHGNACTRCERDKADAIDMPVKPPRAYA